MIHRIHRSIRRIHRTIQTSVHQSRLSRIFIVYGVLVATSFGCSTYRTRLSTSCTHPENTADTTQHETIAGAPLGTTAFIDVSIVPMDEERVLANYTVLIRGGRIVEMGPVANIRIPKGAVEIDARGKFLIPGLADMHAHLFHTLHGETPTGVAATGKGAYTDTLRARRRLALWLANGVTTVRNMDHAFSEPGKLSLMLKAEAAGGTVPSPRIYTAARWRSAADNESNSTITIHWPALGDIEKDLIAYKNAGFDFIKPYFEPKEVFDSLVIIGKRLGIPIGGHIPAGISVYHAMRYMNSIEHPMPVWDKALNLRHPDSTELRALADSMRHYGTWHTPTQSHYIALHGFPVANGIIKYLHDAGIKLLLGTDEPPRAAIIARELASLVAEGLTPYQALSTGTRNVAEYFGVTADVGTVTVGKRADLVLLSANPLMDIQATSTPVGVMIGGRWYTKAAIDERVASLGN